MYSPELITTFGLPHHDRLGPKQEAGMQWDACTPWSGADASRPADRSDCATAMQQKKLEEVKTQTEKTKKDLTCFLR